LWVVPFVGLAAIHPAAPWVFGLLVAAAIAVVGWPAWGWCSISCSVAACPFRAACAG
jgi:hypothetical protein